MSKVKPRSSRRKRAYHSHVRTQQAEATRQALVASARGLFASRGYTATSIDAIAAGAGVSTPTFYATFGSKPKLLLALLATMENEGDLPRLKGELASTDDPRKQIRAVVEFGVRLYARATDVLETIRGAGTAEKDLGELWREGEGRRRGAERDLVKRWDQRGLLAPGLDPEQALDIFWALTGADSFRLFVHECRWSQSLYTEWLSDSLSRQLLRNA